MSFNPRYNQVFILETHYWITLWLILYLSITNLLFLMNLSISESQFHYVISESFSQVPLMSVLCPQIPNLLKSLYHWVSVPLFPLFFLSVWIFVPSPLVSSFSFRAISTKTILLSNRAHWCLTKSLCLCFSGPTPGPAFYWFWLSWQLSHDCCSEYI